jgi:RimJ/RimL family protein N-acetyltransferase
MAAVFKRWEIGKNSVDAYTKILGDNFFWIGTAGAKVILEPGAGKEDNLVLAEYVPMSMFDEERLYEGMEDFVNAVEYWNTEYPKLQQSGGASVPSASASSSSDTGMGRASASISAWVNSWLRRLKNAPQLDTSCLVLRAMHASDVFEIQYHVNPKAVCYNVDYTPHPYTMEMAENWMRNISHCIERRTCCYWAACALTSGEFIGSIGINIFREQDGGELDYWIGERFWNQGYCTEAAKRVMMYVFEDLKRHRLQITHRKGNVASRKVIEKCGFVFE